MMAAITGRDTAPEVAVRRALHRAGLRFRLHRKDLPGRPDIVLPGHRSVVFVHGCFWHRHRGCRFTTHPSTNVAFWKRKFLENVSRDARQRRHLRSAGWKVFVIWECEVRSVRAMEKLVEAIRAH